MKSKINGIISEKNNKNDPAKKNPIYRSNAELNNMRLQKNFNVNSIKLELNYITNFFIIQT